MLITVTRTGGFAGGEKTASLETECRADGPELERLAERVLTAEGPVGQEPVPDGFRYVVRVDSKLVELQDPHLTEDQRQLIDAVLATAA
ncbi:MULTISPECIES: protealysin inhibitor emfourin [unclassified Streptomyces]|uniref:protealysin inhibitor emfourin n=1 Tax=unclassified Streptomyces TaxID=2593676 RepID=UPI003325E57C